MEQKLASQRVTERWQAARQLLDSDPMDQKPVETDGSIQVGDGWEPEAFDYVNNGYKSATTAADGAFSNEGMQPALRIGGELLEAHRKAAKDLTSR